MNGNGSPEYIPCTHIFSNMTDFEWFLEQNCEKGCKRFRNGKCRVYNALLDAMWDKKRFPYDDLLEHAGGYAGMKCKHFTNVPAVRKKQEHPIDGQYALVESEG